MRAEPMESEYDRWSEMYERSTEEFRHELVKAMKVSEPPLLGSVLGALHDIGKLPPEFQKAARVLAARADEERERAFGTGGRARKVSVSMPEELSAAVQERVGRGEFSRYVTEAVARQLEADLLAELTALLEAEHGPVSEELLAEAEAAWPDAE